MMIRLTLVLLCNMLWLASVYASEYGVAHTPAPVLNSPDFTAVFGGTKGVHVKTDHCGQIRALEYIALPGTVFTIIKKRHVGALVVFQVETDEYSVSSGVRLYVDSRFITIKNRVPPPRTRVLPSREKIEAALRDGIGSPYVWGGNVLKGVPELATWFYKGNKQFERNMFMLAGLDCSGLLYHATEGFTPRNTSQLVTFGQGVQIAGKQHAEIVAQLKPFDLIVWKGHVIFVLDMQTAIESRLECGKPGNGGVVTTQLAQRVTEIMRTRRPVDVWPVKGDHSDLFVVRRWYVEK